MDGVKFKEMSQKQWKKKKRHHHQQHQLSQSRAVIKYILWPRFYLIK